MSVEFIWAPYWTSGVLPESYRSGYRRVFGYEHLMQIVVTAPTHGTGGGPANVPPGSPTTRTVYLDHGASTLGSINNGFYLKSARVEAEPPIDFTYQEPWSPANSLGESTRIVQAPPPVPSTYVFPTDLGSSETLGDRVATRRSLVDVTGDGLPDLIDASWECSGNGTSAWLVWRNTGSTFAPEQWDVPRPPDDFLTDAIPDRCALRVVSDGLGVPNFPGETYVTGTVQDFLDVTGDSFPDLIYIDWPTHETVVCPGTGHGFTHCQLQPGIKQRLRHESPSAFSNLQVTDEDLLDFNGDGLVDHLTALGGSEGAVAEVALGRKAGGWAAPFTINLPPCGYPFVASCLRAVESITGGPIQGQTFNSRLYAELRDINGDGLPDFLSTTHSGQIAVYYGTGSDYPSAPKILSASNGPVILGAGTNTNGTYRALADLVDMNADGLPDTVEMNCND
ncbi:MAG: VCBS repeat-containing protein [Deltaproteobacteria bacterium]|nr:VCBS repeat-containing protein [Deltaproteobacteria bacterium]